MAPQEIGVATDKRGITHRVWMVYNQGLAGCRRLGGGRLLFKDEDVTPNGVVTCLPCIGIIDE